MNSRSALAALAVAFVSITCEGAVTVTASRGYVDRKTELHPHSDGGEQVGYFLGTQTNKILASKSYVDAKISATSADFASAVLAVPLTGADAGDVAQIAEYGTYGTVGAALLALIAGLAALKRRMSVAETALSKKADAFKLTRPVYDEYGDAQLVDGAANDIRLEQVERPTDDWYFESGGEYLKSMDYQIDYDDSSDSLRISITDISGDQYTNEVSPTGGTATIPLGRDNGDRPFFRYVAPIDAYLDDNLDGLTVIFGPEEGHTELFRITVPGQNYLADGQTFDWGGATFTLHTEGNITDEERTWGGEITVSGNAQAVLRSVTRPEQNYKSLSIPPPVSGMSRHFVVRIDATSMTDSKMLRVDLRGASTDGDAIAMPDDGKYVVMRFTETSANVLTVEKVYPRPSGGGGGSADDGSSSDGGSSSDYGSSSDGWSSSDSGSSSGGWSSSDGGSSSGNWPEW